MNESDELYNVPSFDGVIVSAIGFSLLNLDSRCVPERSIENGMFSSFPLPLRGRLSFWMFAPTKA